MKTKILIAVYVILVLVCGKILLNYFYNEHVINAYEDEDYSINDDMLLTMNVQEPYVAHYNNGNILYRQGKYEEAIEEYQNAIDSHIPLYSECPVRINMALSMIAQLDKNYKDDEHRARSLEILNDARDVLLEDDCANEKGKGHSKRAERLKRDIEAAIEEL
ncbi:MAG: tetratricopeptide repeat protein, partial [Clostridiales bacterium]|nr:tetratricopeptide repeat protein [Clostridiales bacterium]